MPTTHVQGLNRDKYIYATTVEEVHTSTENELAIPSKTTGQVEDEKSTEKDSIVLYGCLFCIRKTRSEEEMNVHVRCAHPDKRSESISIIQDWEYE